jgi:hypothetical protein
VLAQMAVFQTRDHFFGKYGHVLDNPAVGRELAETYWAPGNSKGFLALVEELTSTPFSADALVKDAARSTDEVVAEAKEKIAKLPEIPEFTGEVDLDLRLRIIHGKETVVEEGGGPLAAAGVFREWILRNWPPAPVVAG